MASSSTLATGDGQALVGCLQACHGTSLLMHAPYQPNGASSAAACCWEDQPPPPPTRQAPLHLHGRQAHAGGGFQHPGRARSAGASAVEQAHCSTWVGAGARHRRRWVDARWDASGSEGGTLILQRLLQLVGHPSQRLLHYPPDAMPLPLRCRLEPSGLQGAGGRGLPFHASHQAAQNSWRGPGRPGGAGGSRLALQAGEPAGASSPLERGIQSWGDCDQAGLRWRRSVQ